MSVTRISGCSMVRPAAGCVAGTGIFLRLNRRLHAGLTVSVIDLRSGVIIGWTANTTPWRAVDITGVNV
jgi:hypothetical protein